MSSKAEKDRQKQIQERCQNMLTQMLRDDDNKYCVDCDAKGPRWASWNLGIFLCIRCAGIHRNLGVHISKVKSVNLDSWTPEQVVSLEQMGNSRARAVYEANLPDNFRRPQTDSALESFIRAKYEHKKYIAREWCPPTLPKVNWDKELEEEEKLKKKKRESKTSTAPINSTIVKKLENVIPAPLPKPASSPKTSRTSGMTSSSATSSPAQSASADLLGLDTPSKEKAGEDDIFGSLVSAEPISSSINQSTPTQSVPVSTTANPAGRSQEEENFFSQPSLTSSQDKKLTKDSILALYSSQPTFPSGGGGMFDSNPMPQAFSSFGGMQNGLSMQPPTVPPGMPQHSNMVAQHGGMVQPGVLPQQQSGMAVRLPNPQQLPQQGVLFGNPMQMASNPFYRMSQQQTTVLPNQPAPNLAHQMAGLNMGQTESLFPAQNQPVSHNLWH